MEKKEMIAEQKKEEDKLKATNEKRMKIKPEEQGDHERTMELSETEKQFLKKQDEDEKALE